LIQLGKIHKLSKTATSNILSAIRFGSSLASTFFPIAMDLLGKYYSQTKDIFDEEVQDIPTWKFLRWMSQILASLRFDVRPSYQRILVRLAQEFPQALFYPYSMSAEDLKDCAEAQETLREVDSSLNVPYLKEFVESLEALDFPLQKYKDWRNATTTTIADSNLEQAVNNYEKFYSQVFRRSEPIFKGFARSYQSSFDKVFGKSGANLKDLVKKKDAKGFTVALQKLKVDESGALPYGKGQLSEFSAFLSNYFGLNSLSSIEIPGQYGGMRKPIPEDHIKIVGFDPSILIMKSMRRPKRITIRGNDEKDYFWLVKSGEDLRLDQRVEQLFEMMNQVFAQDSVCSRRDLSLRTYQVVPMTHRVGIIEWVNNTAPLKGVILDQATILGNVPTSKKRQDIIA
jgi:DNA-dependent protein kinase catalytic subunit